MAAVFLTAAILGCQPAGPPSTAGGQQPLPEFHPDSHGDSLDQALGSDPCSARMQDIEGAFLSFLSNNGNQLPDTLEQLKQVPGLGPGLNLNCPVTGQPYLYSAQGLYLPPESREVRKIILWEPTPSHNGSRVCLLIPRLDPGHGVAMEVKLIPEAEFKKAVPPIQ
jgi:hypothetical protein